MLVGKNITIKNIEDVSATVNVRTKAYDASIIGRNEINGFIHKVDQNFLSKAVLLIGTKENTSRTDTVTRIRNISNTVSIKVPVSPCLVSNIYSFALPGGIQNDTSQTAKVRDGFKRISFLSYSSTYMIHVL